MPPRLCVASRNAHKLDEIRAVLADLPLQVVGVAELAACPEVEEDEPTLEGNAEKKARWVAACSGLWSLADDTGLEVEALDGAPGVFSARWAGPGCSYADNNAKLLRLLRDVPEAARRARFRCVMALAEPGPEAPAGASGRPAPDDAAAFARRVAACRARLFEGRIEGRIAFEPRGRAGFGYDPLFWIPELGRTLAELPAEDKNRISHRARALAALRPALVRLAAGDGGALDASSDRR
jgi:XTP/dITP diphosphohydrolase